MEDLSLHILDIAENSLEAGARNIEISLSVKRRDDRLILRVRDDGRGMSGEVCEMAKDPFFTTKEVRRVGLGIPLLAQSAEACNGFFSIESQQGKGTVVTAEFQLSHIDRKPLGDIGSTMVVLIGSHPGRDFRITFENDGFSYSFDTRELRTLLDGLPITLPDVLQLIKAEINKAIKLEA
ncbi:MAG: ATP-binding protein [Thermodesulfovibrionales bacterium]|jgi:anti-sigma regulatory factor (Ser/Thr protein kinase)